MGNYLAVEDMVFQRDDQKQLLPVDMVLTKLERKRFDNVKDEDGTIIGKKVVIIKEAPKVKVIPPPRGKWLAILGMEPEDQDREILFNHVIEPKIDEDVYSAMIPIYVEAVTEAFTLLALDLTADEVKGKTKEELTEAEEFELKKKLKGEKVEPPSSCTSSDTPSSPSPNSPTEK